MSMISDSGVIENINEIAASITPEEEARIENASLEELLEDLGDLTEVALDLPADESTDIAPAMESLITVVSTIRETGNISRSDAALLGRMTASLEGFQDTFSTMPLGSFTEMPSKVNYEPSMENIASRIIDAIVRKIKEIIDWIMKNGKRLIDAIRNRDGLNKKIGAAARQVGIKFDRSKVKAEFLKSGVIVDRLVHEFATTDMLNRVFEALDAVDKSLVVMDNYGNFASYLDVVTNVRRLASIFGADLPATDLRGAVEVMEKTKTMEKASYSIAYGGRMTDDELLDFLQGLADKVGRHYQPVASLAMVVKNASKAIEESRAELNRLIAENAPAEQVQALQRKLESLRDIELISAAVVWMRSAVWNGIGRSVQLLDRSMK